MNPIFQATKIYSRFAPTGFGGYRLSRIARKFVPTSQWQGEFTTPRGLKLELDLSTYPDCAMAIGMYELDTQRLMRRLLRPGDWFVDCGANIGYFSTFCATVVGPSGRVDSYEPDPENRARLIKHIERNSLQDRVRVHANAVGSEAGTVTLHRPIKGITERNHGEASLFASLVPGGEGCSVERVRLDQDLTGVPQLVKFDVEGAERAAIEGMQSMMAATHPPAIIFEHNPESTAAAGYAPSRIFQKIVQAQPRYKLFWIARFLRRIGSPEALDAIANEGNVLAIVR
jgi:FkbM family methyltransferase